VLQTAFAAGRDAEAATATAAAVAPERIGPATISHLVHALAAETLGATGSDRTVTRARVTAPCT
jgi:hypothetical protein